MNAHQFAKAWDHKLKIKHIFMDGPDLPVATETVKHATPLAARMFREGNVEMQKALARCQFFECSALQPAAQEMLAAEMGISAYSEFAHLPAPKTVLEVHSGTDRIVFLCDQNDQEVSFRVFIPWGSSVVERARFGFVIGSELNLPPQWMIFPGEQEAPFGLLREGDRRIDILRSFNFLVEKLLCIINQPGLVERRPRDTDKRVVKGAGNSTQPPLKWHECRIRSGSHSGYGGSGTDADHREHQLHYVRKYFKPSLSRWVEGYWRGNADLGIHLKWYSPRPAEAGVAA